MAASRPRAAAPAHLFTPSGTPSVPEDLQGVRAVGARRPPAEKQGVVPGGVPATQCNRALSVRVPDRVEGPIGSRLGLSALPLRRVLPARFHVPRPPRGIPPDPLPRRRLAAMGRLQLVVVHHPEAVPGLDREGGDEVAGLGHRHGPTVVSRLPQSYRRTIAPRTWPSQRIPMLPEGCSSQSCGSSLDRVGRSPDF
jgi:hypothetical protein